MKRATNKKSKVIRNETFTIGKPVACLMKILLKSEKQNPREQSEFLGFLERCLSKGQVVYHFQIT